MNRENIDRVKPVNVEQLRNQAADFDVWLSSKEVREAKPEIRIPALSEQRLGSLMGDRPMATYRKLMKHLMTLPEHEQLPAYMYMCGFPDEDIQGVFGVDAVEASMEALRVYELTLQEQVPARTPTESIAKRAVETTVTLPRQRSAPVSRPAPTNIEEDPNSDDLESIEAELEDIAHVDIVRQYIREAAKYKLLAAEEEVFYGQQVQAGIAAQEVLDADKDLSDEKKVELLQTIEQAQHARHMLTNSNLRLVISIVKRYPNTKLLLLDYIQEGNIGLMRAVEKFDPNKGYKFSGYATWWIEQAVGKAFHDISRTIRIPIDASRDVRRVRDVTTELTRTLGRRPTNEQLAEELEFTVKKVVELQQYIPEMRSLDAPLSASEDSSTLGSQIADLRAQRYVDELYNQKILTDALSQLSERQCRIVALTYGLQDGQKHTAQNVANTLGVSLGLVRQEIRTSKDILREYPGLQEIYNEMGD